MVTEIPKKPPPKIPEEEEPPEIPLEEEELPLFTPEEVVRFPTTLTQDGWEFRDIAWNVYGEAINYMVKAPTGEDFTKAEYDAALLQQEEEPERLPEVISDVFPDLTPEGFVDFIETDFEGFIEEMQVGGATEENVALLKQLGYTQEEVDDFYEVAIPAEELLPIEPIMPSSEVIAEAEEIRQKAIAEGETHYFIPQLKAWLLVKTKPKDAWREELGIKTTWEKWEELERKIIEHPVTQALSLISGLALLAVGGWMAWQMFGQRITQPIANMFAARTYHKTAEYKALVDMARATKKPITDKLFTTLDRELRRAFDFKKAGNTKIAQEIVDRLRNSWTRFMPGVARGRELIVRPPGILPPVTRPPVIPTAPPTLAPTVVPPSVALVPTVTSATIGLPPATAQILTGIVDKLATGTLALAQITPEFLVGQIPKGITLEKTASLIAQLKDLGHTTEAITAMKPEEAWANLFKAPITEITPPTVAPEALITPPPTIPAEVPVTPAIEAFLATPDDRIIRPSGEVIDALKARGFSDDYIQTKMSIPEMKQALATPVPEAPDVITKEISRIETELSRVGNLRRITAEDKTLTEAQRTSRTELYDTSETRLREELSYWQGQLPKPPAVEVAKPPVKPSPSLPEQTVEQVATNLATLGQPTLTPTQIERALTLFGLYVENPSTQSAWELTRELRRETLAGRAEHLKVRAQQLIVEKGLPAEEAMNQARRETMSGELPESRTDYLDDLTQEMRDALFNKVYQALKDEPFEMMSTAQALTNALLGKPIPREIGVRGGSAYNRLQRVFAPEVFKALNKAIKEGKSLQGVIEGLYEIVGQPPIPVDQKTADYLRSLTTSPLGQARLSQDVPTLLKLTEAKGAEQIRRETEQLKIELAIEPMPPSPPYEPPIDNAIKQMPMFPRPARDMVIKVLKEIGWSPVDIGNFLRANKASVDMSFWRQQAPLILNHKVDFVQANVEAWKAMWSQKAAEASYQRILKDPLYHLYDQIGVDFLRPLELAKGTSQWMGTEEFGYITGERLIPRLTGKIPWVKFSSRSFVTGTNVHNWRIFKNHYNAMLGIQEKIASGEITLKPGEVFSIEKEMTDMAKLLTDFTARGQLGPARPLAPAISSLFFAPRMALGRILTPRHLVSANPRIRAEAWKDLIAFVSGVGGLVLLGYMMDWWEVELDPHSAEYMSIRIGNTRIDPWGGFRQYLVFLTRVVTGTGLSSVTGAEYDVNPLMATTHFVRGKASPMASIIADFWVGKTFVGEEVDVANKKQWIERVAPFAVWDVYEAYMDDPIRGVAVVIPAVVGAGVQTYTGDWIENWTKLGLPKYSDNLAYGLTEPYYDVADFWTDTSAQFADVDPATLTKEKGFPNYIRAIAEARVINEQLKILPNEKLVNLNADPEVGTTFADYYQMWQDREKLVLAGDDAKWTVRELQPDGKYKEVTYKGEEAVEAFDKDERTRNANLGNFSQRQFALLNQYWAITDKKEQADFLKEHESEIGTNLRRQWLRTHPKENAQLAVWGQAKILSIEAYRETKRLIKELDIPDNAIPEFTIPPEGSVDNYFKYLETGDDLGYNSWEVQLIIAQDDDLREFLDRQPIITPVEALELKIKHRDLFEEYDTLETDEDRQALKADNPEWVDDMRRIEAYENNAPEDIVGKWVERGNKIDEFGSSSSEALLWLVDNPDVYDWAVENELLEDNREENRAREPILRINVDYATEDDWYNEGIPARHAGVAYKNRAARDAGITEERFRYLVDNPEYNEARYRRDAYGLKDKTFTPFPDELIETYVDYYTNPDLKKPDDWKETSGTDEWYEDDWFLQENPEFHQALVDYGRFTELRDLSKVPTREVFTLYQEYLGVEGSQARLNFRHANPELENWLVEFKEYKPVGNRWTAPSDPVLANKKYWLELASHFKNLLKNLGIREDITPEELTDEQMEQIKRAIRQLYE